MVHFGKCLFWLGPAHRSTTGQPKNPLRVQVIWLNKVCLGREKLVKGSGFLSESVLRISYDSVTGQARELSEIVPRWRIPGNHPDVSWLPPKSLWYSPLYNISLIVYLVQRRIFPENEFLGSLSQILGLWAQHQVKSNPNDSANPHGAVPHPRSIQIKHRKNGTRRPQSFQGIGRTWFHFVCGFRKWEIPQGFWLLMSYTHRDVLFVSIIIYLYTLNQSKYKWNTISGFGGFTSLGYNVIM